jgi:hypothetical protein
MLPIFRHSRGSGNGRAGDFSKSALIYETIINAIWTTFCIKNDL